MLTPDDFRQSDLVEVRRVANRGKGGRAVVARRDIAAGEIIERAPVLLIPRSQVFGNNEIASRATTISWYVFTWVTPGRDHVALALGYGSIYNHLDDPNAEYKMELPDVMTFTARRAIRAGEEVTINYSGNPGKTFDPGFEVVVAKLAVSTTADGDL